MCNHIWKKVNDTKVCIRCGMTVLWPSGEIIFDRKLPDSNRKKGSK